MRTSPLPFPEAHELLNLTGTLFVEDGWTLKEHNALYNEFYPAKTEAALDVLEMTCMGRKVPEDKIKEARDEQGNPENIGA